MRARHVFLLPLSIFTILEGNVSSAREGEFVPVVCGCMFVWVYLVRCAVPGPSEPVTL